MRDARDGERSILLEDIAITLLLGSSSSISSSSIHCVGVDSCSALEPCAACLPAADVEI